ncbi:hypothetical protein B0J11DRAFT_577720 [Dendryphion nanum]|uniref:Uncharacterized protein n=1 Tax=Dendryphion nanum TaxID=256645 RepID=A0A9P9E1B8_9PLEO|nr:hypothetical protein B0J11DRAFT_577720 [Dendryphion nanum]
MRGILGSEVQRLIARNSGSEDSRPLSRARLHSSLTWDSPVVASAFQHYWNTNTNYLSAKAEVLHNEINLPNLHGDLVKIFHRLGYLEIPLEGIEGFITCGDVHPIFHRVNWITDLPYMNIAYDAMLPALRLATEMIRCKRATKWWSHVRNGTIDSGSPSSTAYLKSATERNLMNDKKGLQGEFLEFSRRVRFTWMANSKMDSNNAFSIGSLPGLLQLLGGDADRKYQRKKYMREPNPSVVLPLDVFHRLLSSSTTAFTACQDLRFQFLFAKMLVHELGHCWYAYWHGPLVTCNRSKRSQEPKAFESDLFPEMGFSLEWSIFGANLSTLDFGKNHCATVGPMIATRPQDDYPIINPALAFVPMAWVRQWFHKHTWENLTVYEENGWLRPPTIDEHPQLFRLARYKNGVFHHSIEIFLERDAIPATGGAIHESRTAGALQARKYPSVAAWYQEIWEREARLALEAGKLPSTYYTTSPTEAIESVPSSQMETWARMRWKRAT